MKEQGSLPEKRSFLAKDLVETLKKTYDQENWKYRLIKEAKEKYNYRLFYNQLHKFEVGEYKNVDVYLLVLSEIGYFEKHPSELFDTLRALN